MNPNNANDGNRDEDNDGYTNLEEFLNMTSPRANPVNPTPPPNSDDNDFLVIPLSDGRAVVAPLEH